MTNLIESLSSTGTEVAGHVVSAAVAALVVFAAIYGVRLVLRAFKVASGGR